MVLLVEFTRDKFSGESIDFEGKKVKKIVTECDRLISLVVIIEECGYFSLS